VERWDGNRWAIESSPTPTGSYMSDLVSVACTTPTRCVAVGLFHSHAAAVSGDNTLIEQYS
jgi:hypothetical protein